MAVSVSRAVAAGIRDHFMSLPGWARVFVLTFALYGIPAATKATWFTTHSHLAYAILNGSFSLPAPYGTTEIVHWPNGEKYVAYGVTPSFFLMPFVAILGRGVHQPVCSAIFGAAGVACFWAFLGHMKGVSEHSRKWLTILLAAGSPFAYYAAENGGNWSITHSVAVVCLLACMLLSRTGNPGWAGLFFGLGVLSRNPVLYLAPAMVLVLWAPEAESWREIRPDWRKLAVFLVGFGVAALIGAYYNWARFDTPFENGYTHILNNDPIADFGRKPAFALEYARHNVQHYLFNPPIRYDRFPWYGPDIAGMSMFLAFPALLLLPLARFRRPLVQVALACMLVVQAMYWVFIGDGRGQFGMRYTTDYLPMVMLLLMTALGTRFGRFAQVLTVLGFLVEIWGFATWRANGW
ncbi:MAG: glycosyltransferase family 39 protein [Candidatus Sericytochromatia bacterium]|nr:glycosyltransferase family 39 protein [Candidatus Tanganyikabacteria bacterium]